MISEKRQFPVKIDVVAFEDQEGLWVAQGIQYDIVATARSVPDLRKAFVRQVQANLALNAKLGREGLDGIPPAPEAYRRLWEQAEVKLEPLPPHPQNNIDMRLAEAA